MLHPRTGGTISIAVRYILLWCHLRRPGFVIIDQASFVLGEPTSQLWSLGEELGGKNTNQKRGVSIPCYLAWMSVLISHDTKIISSLCKAKDYRKFLHSRQSGRDGKRKKEKGWWNRG